jgi:hypothetical protein
MMQKFKFVVLTNPKDGRDAEYNEWYDNRHLQDVLAVPGFVAAERYHAAPEMIASGQVKWRYLAIYDIETSDLAGTMADMISRGGTDAMPISDALDVEGAHAVAYIARGPTA